jgi:hypothetical protein
MASPSVVSFWPAYRSAKSALTESFGGYLCRASLDSELTSLKVGADREMGVAPLKIQRAWTLQGAEGGAAASSNVSSNGRMGTNGLTAFGAERTLKSRRGRLVQSRLTLSVISLPRSK